MKLKDKVAIITGAASGIGKEIAKTFADEGAHIIISDINFEKAEMTANEIQGLGGRAIAIKTDITKEEDINKLFLICINKFGTIDILVNNAGIMDNMAAIGDVTDDMWYKVLEVNTTSVMRTTRKAIPLFLDKKSGVIINIASVGAIKGSIAGVAYTASKHAVIGITKNTAFQYAREGIRCNAIAPGPVRTEINGTINNTDERGTKICRSGMSIIPRLGEPEEIAKVALFLACEDSSFVNGAVITADGGWSAY